MIKILMFVLGVGVMQNCFADTRDFLSPQDVAFAIAKDIDGKKTDSIYSSYFDAQITVQVDDKYLDCMHEASRLIAVSEYKHITVADIAKIKQRAFDAVCLPFENIEIQNKDWYALVYRKCMTSDKVVYRHFTDDKYDEFRIAQDNYFEVWEQRDESALAKLDEVWSVYAKLGQEFFSNDLSERSDNNKPLWCDCLAAQLVGVADYEKQNDYSTLRVLPSDESDFVKINNMADRCYHESVMSAAIVSDPVAVLNMFIEQNSKVRAQAKRDLDNVERLNLL